LDWWIKESPVFFAKTNILSQVQPVMETFKQQTLMRPMGGRVILAIGLLGSLFVSSGFAAKPPYNTVITTVSVGQEPVAIAVSPNSKTAYVANYSSSSVSVIDADKYDVVATTPVAPHPQCLAVSPDGTKLYVSSGGTPGTISVIDTTQPGYPVSTSFSVGSDNLAGLAVTPNGDELYVANPGDLAGGVPGTLLVLDTSNYSLTTTLQTGGQPYQILVPKDGSQAELLNNAGTGYLQYVDWATNKILRSTVAGGQFFFPAGIAIDGLASKLFVTSQVNYVSIIDAKTGSIIKQCLAQADESTAMELGQPAVKPNAQFLYVPYTYNETTGVYGNQVAMLLVYTGEIDGSPIQVGNNPTWIELSPNADTLYVANKNDGTVTVINSMAQ
jgi:YVTN family beta-propeller protein